MPRPKQVSTRSLLRAFQNARSEHPDDGIRDDLALLQAKDLDLSVRLGALLAFDALLTTAAINPISASPGAPLSLDAPTQPVEVIVITIGVFLLAGAALLCVRAIMLGEDFETNGVEEDAHEFMQRMFAAYCASIDFQTRQLLLASRLTLAGGLISGVGCLWIMLEKMFG